MESVQPLHRPNTAQTTQAVPVEILPLPDPQPLDSARAWCWLEDVVPPLLAVLVEELANEDTKGRDAAQALGLDLLEVLRAVLQLTRGGDDAQALEVVRSNVPQTIDWPGQLQDLALLASRRPEETFNGSHIGRELLGLELRHRLALDRKSAKPE